ncbi:hypothetical protein BQ9231_00070 [Cedratvirus lausannensis]|uniref:Uncharacterized protein n=1 Tax=Cedratvirus lausannensis TaxID=2023205 RepID=A0A285PWC3_9VIRU|nr:hypothetical protein BQ9231_00070 [Cedratvirus lausannensis]
MFRVSKPAFLTPSATYNYSVVLFENMPALCMQNFPSFPNCHTLFVVDCDKNFVFHHVLQRHFPNVTRLFLYSHPCDSCVLYRDFPIIYLAERHAHYKKRWVPDRKNVYLISQERLEEEIKNSEEMAKLEDRVSYLEDRSKVYKEAFPEDSCKTQ